MGRVVRKVVSGVERAAHQYLFYRDQEAAAKRAKDKAVAVPGDRKANLIKNYIAEHGEANGDHVDWLFTQPLTIGDQTYLGMRNQASSSTYMDTDKAEELLKTKGLRDQVFKTVEVEVADWDEVYRLIQQGLITDDEYDALMETETTYSLVVIK